MKPTSHFFRSLPPQRHALLLVAGLLAACGTEADDPEMQDETPVRSTGVYLLASLSIRDFAAFQSNYAEPVFPMLIAAGGEVLVATPEVDILEGEYPQNWTVVVRFPTQAAIDGWYQSDEYQDLISERRAATDPTMSRLLVAREFAQAPSSSIGGHFLLASLQVTDFEAFQRDYGAGVFPLLAEAGGEILVGAPEVEMLEGEYPANWSVVVRFPSEAAAQSWFDSDAYQQLIPQRHENTNLDVSTLMFAPGFAPQ